IALSLHAHPLSPLTTDEIAEAARMIRQSGRVPGPARFITLTLDEPSKAAILRGETPPRRAFAVLYDARADQTFEAVANLTAHSIERAEQIPNVQPMIGGEDSARVDQILRADPRWREALLARGVRNLRNVVVISWSAGHFALPGAET